MRLTAGRKIVWFSIVAILIGATLTAGANGTTIEVRNEGNRIVWTASASFENARLTVGLPNGTVVERTFEGGQAVSFSPLDLAQIEAADGLYTWQIVLSPVVSQETRRILDEARENGDFTVVEFLRQRGELPAEEELIRSGSFRFVSRSLVSGEAVETGGAVAATKGSGGPVDLDDPTRAQVIVTDLVVQGSECVGFDCVNGESFGFDTIRLKENNLRIHFQDTSSSASFPTNDWRIVANDTSNGGANYLAVEDSNTGRQVFKVTAGAPANSVLVDSAGDVGLGTSNPVLELHISDGDTPAIRLEQNGSSGWAPQTWDVAGNETNFFIRDATNGSRLPFRIRAAAPDDSIYVDTDGDIGFGTSSPDASLHVVAVTGGGPVDSIHLQNNGPSRIKLSNTAITNTATEDQDWIFNSNGTLRITAGGDAAEFTLDGEGNLTVTGSFQVNGTALNVPDFVFADGYALMPLADLGDFVQRNHHLPGIPSATEVNSSVLDMTELQLQLLQKIEELTLYTIQQQSTIEKLHSRIAELEDSAD